MDLPLLGEDPELPALRRADRTEVAAVERDDQVRIEPIREHGDRRVDRSEWEVPVALDEVGDEGPVVGVRGFDIEVAQAPDECGLTTRAKAPFGKPGDLGDDERRDDEVQVPPTKDRGTCGVTRIPSVDRGEQWTRVKDRG